MPIEIEYEPNDIYVLRISGILKQSEFAAEQADIARTESTVDRNPACSSLERSLKVWSAARIGMISIS